MHEYWGPCFLKIHESDTDPKFWTKSAVLYLKFLINFLNVISKMGFVRCVSLMWPSENSKIFIRASWLSILFLTFYGKIQCISICFGIKKYKKRLETLRVWLIDSSLNHDRPFSIILMVQFTQLVHLDRQFWCSKNVLHTWRNKIRYKRLLNW